MPVPYQPLVSLISAWPSAMMSTLPAFLFDTPMSSPLTFLTLAVDMQREIEDRLDLLSLLKLGGTCLYFRDRVSATLQMERDRIIKRFWSHPPAFLSMLTRCRAVISGEAALAFVMRNRSLLGHELEVCVSASFGDNFLSEIEDDPLIQRASPWSTSPYPEHLQPTEYLYLLPSGRRIRVIVSNTETPFTQMAFYPSSALCNYMDEFSFGCAYRDLTLNRRAIIPFSRTDEEDHRIWEIEHRGGFLHSPWAAQIAVPPRPFALFNASWSTDENVQVDLVNSVCLRPSFQCTGQPRYFGDAGSLIEFFEPDMVDHGVMAHWQYAPYGPTALWRTEGADCDYECGGGDYLLRGSGCDACIVAQPMHYGPFTSAVVPRIRIGESERRRVWKSLPEDIRLQVRNVLWRAPTYDFN